MSAIENGGCDANDNVPVEVTVNDVGGGTSGFNILVDGASVGTFSYDASGTTIVSIDVIGDAQSHNHRSGSILMIQIVVLPQV